jgi:hypothetical protein
VAFAGVVAALVLHDHHFSATFHTTVNGVPEPYRAARLPLWRDPLALILAFTAIAAGVLIAKRPMRIGLALGVVGCAFAGAVYLHQQAVHTIICAPFMYGCVFTPSSPDLWHHAASLLVMAAGIAVAVALLLPRRWLLAPRLRTGRA